MKKRSKKKGRKKKTGTFLSCAGRTSSLTDSFIISNIPLAGADCRENASASVEPLEGGDHYKQIGAPIMSRLRMARDKIHESPPPLRVHHKQKTVSFPLNYCFVLRVWEFSFPVMMKNGPVDDKWLRWVTRDQMENANGSSGVFPYFAPSGNRTVIFNMLFVSKWTEINEPERERGGKKNR